MYKFKFLKFLSLTILFSVMSMQTNNIKYESIDKKKMAQDINKDDKLELFVRLDKDIIKALCYIKEDLRGSGKAIDYIYDKLNLNKNIIPYKEALDLIEELKDLKANFDKDLQENLEDFEDKVNDIKEDRPIRSRSNKKYCNVCVKGTLCANNIKAEDANFCNVKIYPGGSLDITGASLHGVNNCVSSLSPFVFMQGDIRQVSANSSSYKAVGLGFSFSYNSSAKTMTITFDKSFAEGSILPVAYLSLYNIESTNITPAVYITSIDNKGFKLDYSKVVNIDPSLLAHINFLVMGPK